MKRLIACLLLAVSPGCASGLDCSDVYAEKKNKPLKEGTNPKKALTGAELNAVNLRLKELCEALQDVIDTQGSTGGGVYPTPPPSISSCNPTQGGIGTEITCLGSGLATMTSFKVNGVEVASRQIVSDAQVKGTVAEGTTTGSIVITTTVSPPASGVTFIVDTTPGTPQALNVTSTDYPSIYASWVAPVGGLGTGTYIVQWVSDIGGVPGVWGAYEEGIALTNIPITTGIENGKTYWVRVRVQNGTVAGPWTEPKSATVPAAPAPEGKYVSHSGSDAAAGTFAAPWKTLAYAVQQMLPGETLYIRGGPAGSDDNTPCSTEGDKGGACWREVVGTIPRSPLQFLGGTTAKAGTAAGGYITYACYPGEVCIIEPATGYAGVIYGDPAGADPARCSYIKLQDLIIDARNMGDQEPPLSGNSADGVRFDYSSAAGGSNTDPAKWCNHIEILGGKIRHARNVGGIHAMTADMLIDGVELYENGAFSGGDISNNCNDGEHDHAIYGLGVRWTITNNYIHDNIQAIQMWNSYGGSAVGSHVIEDNVFANNRRNPWASSRWAAQASTQPAFRTAANLGIGDQCNLGLDGSYHAYGSVAVFYGTGGGTAAAPTTISGNEIYGINEWGAAACTDWAKSNYVSVTGNYIYNFNDGGDPGTYTQVRNDGTCTGITVSGNVEGPKP